MVKWTIRSIMLLATIVSLGILRVGETSGQNPGAIWTTRNGCGTEQQDVNLYETGETVYINGSGFIPGTYPWSIKGQPGGASGDPNTVVASGNVTTPTNTPTNTPIDDREYIVPIKKTHHPIHTPTNTPTGTLPPTATLTNTPTVIVTTNTPTLTLTQTPVPVQPPATGGPFDPSLFLYATIGFGLISLSSFILWKKKIE